MRVHPRRHLYGSLPSDLKEQVFGGGTMPSTHALKTTAIYALSNAQLADRMPYEPPEHYRTWLHCSSTSAGRSWMPRAAIPADDPKPNWD